MALKLEATLCIWLKFKLGFFVLNFTKLPKKTYDLASRPFLEQWKGEDRVFFFAMQTDISTV